MLVTILIVILVIALLGGLPSYGGRGPYLGTGYYGGGAVGLVLIILLILFIAGRV